MNNRRFDLCFSEEEMILLTQIGFPEMDACVNYLAGGLDTTRGEEQKVEWQHRKYETLLKTYAKLFTIPTQYTLVAL